MTYAFLLILSLVVAFVAFGFIAYTAGRARGFEACYRQMDERPTAQPHPKPHREGSHGAPPAVHLSGATLFASLPERFTTRTLAALYSAAGTCSYRRASRAACQMTQRWLQHGLLRRTARGRFIKTPPEA